MIDLVLYGPSGPQPLGHPATVRVRLRNAGDRDLWIAGVLDGSENGLRLPRYRPTVTRLGDGVVVGSPVPAEDPLVAPLRPADLRALAPGESWDPTSGPGCLPLMTFAHFIARQSGRYRYALTLDTEADTGAARPADWLGGFGLPAGTAREELLALVARVPRTRVVADPVEVDFH
ncbi:hypothetical protein MUK60_05235 [Streptomyces sp. LRE541]|uniref:hypothetical protein n=1 Tax=Streptomyces sp. LRE541 TaxID=2931983 RepID=UPI00200CE213|nr:hypothetical protein [Streptomyces sp. LRE541]UPZ27270.1 hypothetical protein MUK60_05235 [Streptomyces sp. LRE541]